MPILPPLISVDDLTDYWYDPAVAVKIPAASARVRRATRQQITPGTDTITVNGSGPWLLPQRPVNEVLAVTTPAGAPVTWELNGPFIDASTCAPLLVTYSHGWDPLPDELVELICSIAARLASQSDAMAAGVRTEQAGGESVTWGADAWSGTTGLTRPELDALRRIFPPMMRLTSMQPEMHP